MVNLHGPKMPGCDDDARASVVASEKGLAFPTPFSASGSM